jgi:hypothetical protein
LLYHNSKEVVTSSVEIFRRQHCVGAAAIYLSNNKPK